MITSFYSLTFQITFSAYKYASMVVVTDRIKWLAQERVKSIRAALFMLGVSVRAVFL